jgi:hypothetical protein
MKFDVQRHLIKLRPTNPDTLEASVERIISSLRSSRPVANVVGVNITNECLLIIEADFEAEESLAKIAKILASKIQEVAAKINDNRFDCELAIPISYQPYTYNIWDNRKVMDKTKDLIAKVDAFISDKLHIGYLEV